MSAQSPKTFPAFHQSEVFFRCMEDSSDAIMLTDTSGTIVYVNKAWQKIYGYSEGEALGKTPRMLRSGRHGADFYRRMWKEILDPAHGYWKGEVTNRLKDGREATMLLTISPFREGGGNVQGYMSIAVDITRQKRLDSQLQRQDRLASVGLLASGLAHEVGTPLGVIRGRAEYLLSDASPAQRESLTVIISQIDRISRLIYSLLHLARQLPADGTTTVGLREVTAEVLPLLAQKCRASRIEVQIDIPDDARVQAEADGLQQVFLNLLMNGVQAIETAIETGRAEDHELSVRTAESDGKWELTISDTGCGISDENMRNLFKPFFTTKDIGSGTGLGLVVVNQLVHSWNGSVWVESTPNQGTKFHVALPKA